MEMVQTMSLPYTRTDNYERKAGPDPLVKTQSKWPLFIHGHLCYTEMYPFKRCMEKAVQLPKYWLNMWAGSKLVSKKLKEMLKNLEVDLFLYKMFEEYYLSFVHPNTNAQAPPQNKAAPP